MDTILYTIPVNFTLTVEVYGDPDNAAYEWRLLDNGKIRQDTGTEGRGVYRGRMYGAVEIALRDALMVATGMDDPGRQPVPDDKPES